MSVFSPDSVDIRQELPLRLRDKVASVLDTHEPLLAWFEPDLDAGLNFSQGLLLLTKCRLIGLPGAETAPSADVGRNSAARFRQLLVLSMWTPEPRSYSGIPSSWPLSHESNLRIREMGGAAALDLINDHGLLARWRFTPARTKAAHHFVESLESLPQRANPASEPGETRESFCPSCGAAVKGGQGLCDACTAPPGIKAGRSLLRC